MVKKSLLHDPQSVQIHTRGYLPHWQQPGATYSVTFRLHDSLPREVMQRLREERRAMVIDITRGLRPLNAVEKAGIRTQFELTLDRELSRERGASYMRVPAIAEIVAHTLTFFDGSRYELTEWCVMPNHVHALVTPASAFTLDQIIGSWKRFSARSANRLLGRTGAFWQREYFDRIIRDERDLAGCIAYIRDNPTKAGLRDWRWSSRGRPVGGGPAG